MKTPPTKTDEKRNQTEHIPRDSRTVSISSPCMGLRFVCEGRWKIAHAGRLMDCSSLPDRMRHPLYVRALAALPALPFVFAFLPDFRVPSLLSSFIKRSSLNA